MLAVDIEGVEQMSLDRFERLIRTTQLQSHFTKACTTTLSLCFTSLCDFYFQFL